MPCSSRGNFFDLRSRQAVDVPPLKTTWSATFERKRTARSHASQKSFERTTVEEELDPATHSPVLLFHYPTTVPAGFEYFKRSVKLEFGSLADQKPAGRHAVSPRVADILEEVFRDWSCEVVLLEAERIFWEKATIHHAECRRAPATSRSPTGSRRPRG